MTISILHGDCRETLKTLPECSVHMAVTSPPYWGLRAYLPAGHALKALELGSEATPDEFVSNLVGVFREVRRVLRDDGVVFVNIGDTYSAGGNRLLIPALFALAMQADGWRLRDEIIWHKPAPMPSSVDGVRWERCKVKVAAIKGGVKQVTSVGSLNTGGTDKAIWSDCPGCPKCRDNDGWVLRRGSWRTTAAHEMIYLFDKTSDYYCDAEAVRVPAAPASVARVECNGKPAKFGGNKADGYGTRLASGRECTNATSANPRSVWTIGPEPLRHKHYAAYPSEIPRRCILAGTSAKGVCAKCGAPWARMVEKPKVGTWHEHDNDDVGGQCGQTKTYDRSRSWPETKTIGWRATCDCNAGDPIPATVLDPFGGSGTTAIAAKLLGRNAILCELNPEYVEIQRTRFAETAPLIMGA